VEKQAIGDFDHSGGNASHASTVKSHFDLLFQLNIYENQNNRSSVLCRCWFGVRIRLVKDDASRSCVGDLWRPAGKCPLKFVSHQFLFVCLFVLECFPLLYS